MLDLVAHLGSVHRWAAEVVRSREVAEQPAAPPDPAALAPWFAAGVELLLDRLRGAEPGTPCWGFGPPPRLVDFWPRRQALETAVHRWDALSCLGRAPAIAVDLAEDGVDEVVSVLFARQVRLGRIEPLKAAVRLESVETGASWVLSGDGIGPPAKVAGSVTAPAATLLLLLWRRIAVTAPGVAVTGDAAAVERAFEMAWTP